MKIALIQRVILAVAFGLSSPALALHIVVDPGHGGKDRGATKSGVHESEIVLKVSRYLEELLENDPRFEVSMTRRTDQFISLKNRGHLAVQSKGDLFVSIHVNSSPDHKAHGVEFYFQNQLPPDEESIFLAARENELEEDSEERPALTHHAVARASNHLKGEVKTILSDMIKNHKILDSSLLTKTLKEHWKGDQRSSRNAIRQAPFYVVSQVPIPSVLVELGFITHPGEAQRLQNSGYQKLLAQSIYEGLVAYKTRQSD